MELIEEAKNTGTGSHEAFIDQSSKCFVLDPMQLFHQLVSLRAWQRPVPLEVEVQALSSTGDPQQLSVKILVPSVREAHVLEGTVECDTMTIALRFCERAVHIKDHHSKH
jgi:hypothetical protein